MSVLCSGQQKINTWTQSIVHVVKKLLPFQFGPNMHNSINISNKNDQDGSGRLL